MAGIGAADVLEAIDADPRACARWLEMALTGLDLSAVITDLAILGGGSAEGVDATADAVRVWLGPHADAVLGEGLERLPVGKLRELLRAPARLAGLQELVLTGGGTHWNARVRGDSATGELAARHRRALVQRLGLADQARRAAGPAAG